MLINSYTQHYLLAFLVQGSELWVPSKLWQEIRWFRFRFRFRNVLFTGMLHQLNTSWSSVTSCVHTKQKVTIDNNNPRTTINNSAEVTEEKENKLRKIKARIR